MSAILYVCISVCLSQFFILSLIFLPCSFLFVSVCLSLLLLSTFCLSIILSVLHFLPACRLICLSISINFLYNLCFPPVCLSFCLSVCLNSLSYPCLLFPFIRAYLLEVNFQSPWSYSFKFFYLHVDVEIEKDKKQKRTDNMEEKIHPKNVNSNIIRIFPQSSWLEIIDITIFVMVWKSFYA